MENNIITSCPVCGKPRISVDPGTDCRSCGFVNAYVRYFAGAKSYQLRVQEEAKAKSDYHSRQIIRLADAGSFVLGSRLVGFCAPQTGKLCLLFDDGRTLEHSDVLQLSAGPRNYVVLFSDGSVKVFGEDNSYGQRNTASWANITEILSAANCTYGIDSKGNVLTAGSPVSTEVRSWKQIRKLRCSETCIIGITENGSLLAAGQLPDGVTAERLALQNNIKQFAVLPDCCIILHHDGTVSYVGEADNEKAAAAQWHDVASLSTDGTFIYGLTTQGNLLLAGKCRPFLDAGRSGAAQWKELIVSVCSPFGVAAVTRSGDLLLAGNVMPDTQKLIDTWNSKMKSAWEAQI